MTISIANRILLGFAFIVALMVGLGAYTINQLDDATTTTETIVTRDLALQRLLDLTARSQNEMRGAREEALSRFLLRSLGQPQGSHEELIADWGRRAASTESSLNQAIATTNNYLSSALTSQRAGAWRRIGELLNQASGQLRQIRVSSERQFNAVEANDLAAILAAENALRPSRDAWSSISRGNQQCPE